MAEFEKYIPVVDTLVNQAYYRVLSFVSFRAPIDEAYQACQSLIDKRGGKLYWVIEGRVAKWEDFEVYPDIKMSVYLFGSKIRRKNTVMCRVGWWKMYLIDTIIKVLARPFGALS
jgi:hypothetical protein